jgi:hypothetical protein
MSFLNPLPQLRHWHPLNLSPAYVYTGKHNEQKEAKHYRKDKHRKRSYEQGKQIKYCDDQNGASPKLDKSIFLQRNSLYVHPALPLTI